MSHGILSLCKKNYKKRLNGSKDIVIWKIERSDWSRAFTHKSQERKFSQIWGWCRKLANYNTLHFRSLLSKTNDSIFHTSPKSSFLCILVPFFPFLGKMRIFLKNLAPPLLCPYGPGTSYKKSEKSYEPIWSKYKK